MDPFWHQDNGPTMAQDRIITNRNLVREHPQKYCIAKLREKIVNSVADPPHNHLFLVQLRQHKNAKSQSYGH